MGQSKDLFMMMREQEVATIKFLPSKKQLQKSSKEFANKMMNTGEHNVQELYSQALRLKEALTVIETELKSKLPQENFEAFGLKGTYRSGGDSLNYGEDVIYAGLKKDLADRADLLKLAQKQDVLDLGGNEVIKVSSTPRKSSLAISF